MGMAAILFNGVEPYEQSVKTLLTESPIWYKCIWWKLLKQLQKFKNYTILYMYIAQW